jgi:hypothetical protein
MSSVQKSVLSLVGAVALAGLADQAAAFCGFYVSTDDAQLFNNASKVVIARRGNLTTMTMANDYKGDAKQFAIVIPLPTVVKKEQIRVSESAIIDQIEGYTKPRLAAYYDEDPCPEPYEYEMLYDAMPAMAGSASSMRPMRETVKSEDYGVKIEASYDVGEYDILILAAEQSDGLERWLVDNGYNIPRGASDVLGSYIKQNMKFFVAKVDLAEKNKLAQPFLRPLQVEYESPKFMLPIRLGMVNAEGPQDLLVFALTETGRVETTNYRTTKIPTDANVPEYIEQEFGSFYTAMFEKQVTKQGMETVFLEYAWPLSISCDPCTGIYMSGDTLNKMGATWASEYHGGVNGGFVTRLHVRYDMAHFPEDLAFQETADSSTFQGRYVINHAFRGDTSCDAGKEYVKALYTREEQDIQSLASLTGWPAEQIRKKMPNHAAPPTPARPPSWWEQQ